MIAQTKENLNSTLAPHCVRYSAGGK